MSLEPYKQFEPEFSNLHDKINLLRIQAFNLTQAIASNDGKLSEACFDGLIDQMSEINKKIRDLARWIDERKDYRT